MRLPQIRPRALRWLALPLAVLTAHPAASAGLQNGEVFANGQFAGGGETTTATEPIDMKAIAPDPNSNPPPPPTFAPARSGIAGTMGSLTLNAEASINSTFLHISSASEALIEFTDNLVVNAEGVEAGTDLIVKVAWRVSGDAEFHGPNRIKSRAKLLLEADGVDLDPDPDAPEPPKQQWTRDVSNFVPVQLDDLGLVTFEYLVQEGTPEPGNIQLRSAAGVLCGGSGSLRTGAYDSGASAILNFDFVGATGVRTADGEELYRWTTNALSTLEYGSRADNPPSNPVLTVGPSDGGSGFVNLSWPTILGEYYLVQGASEPAGPWTTITEVRATGGVVDIDLFKNPASTFFRLRSRFGTGTPDPTLVTPRMHILRAGASVRIAWLTNHWENHDLNEIDGTGAATPVHQAVGDGGVVWFDFEPTPPGRIFQVESSLK